MNRALAMFAGAVLCLALLPAAAFAQQATIAGVARDTSGAVLPGVTVEVSSPALIEKTRGAVTDGSGQYQIIQLVPGTYTVTFSLQGFNTFKRDAVEVSGAGVVTINADMKVGEIAETITVTGQTSLVDVRSAGVQRVVTKEVVDAVPTGRLGINLAALQPGIILGAGGGVGVANTNALNSQDVGGTAGDTFTDLSIHGGKPAEQRQTRGGLSAATTIRFGESLSSSPSFPAMQEMTVNTAGAAGPSGTLPEFVAWPFEDYPARLFDPSALLSFGVISNKTNKWGNTNVDFSNAAITVRQRGGATLTVSRVSYDTQGYGLPNNIQFAVSGLQANTYYDVTIDRVAVGGVQRSYSYFFRIVP